MGNNKQNILLLLASSFLFCGTNSQQLQELAQKAKIHTYRTRHMLIEEEFVNDKIYIILDGMVKVYRLTPDGKEIFLAIEKTNDYLGTMDLDDKPASATIQVLCPTTVIIFYKKDLINMLDRFPFLWKNMYKITLAKLRELNQLHSIRLGNDLYKRTYLLLQYLAKHSIHNTIMLSHETIASIVGATRPRVTETLHALEKAGKITISPKRIIVV